jgi:hypothetical protein
VNRAFASKAAQLAASDKRQPGYRIGRFPIRRKHLLDQHIQILAIGVEICFDANSVFGRRLGA